MPTRLTSVLVTAAAFLLLAGTASAKLPAKINGTLPAGGTATFTSPPIEPGAKTMAVDVTSTDPETRFINKVQVLLTAAPSPKDRFITCVSIYRNMTRTAVVNAESVSITYKPDVLASLFLAACLEMAAEISRGGSGGPPTASAAQSGCPAPVGFRVPVKLTGSGARRGAKVSGEPTPVRRTALKIACKPKGNGYVMRVRPRNPRRTLRSVAGDRLRIGFLSAADATKPVPLSLTFRR